MPSLSYISDITQIKIHLLFRVLLESFTLLVNNQLLNEDVRDFGVSSVTFTVCSAHILKQHERVEIIAVLRLL